MEFRDGLVAHEPQYFGDRFEPSPSRANLVERVRVGCIHGTRCGGWSQSRRLDSDGPTFMCGRNKNPGPSGEEVDVVGKTSRCRMTCPARMRWIGRSSGLLENLSDPIVPIAAPCGHFARYGSNDV